MKKNGTGGANTNKNGKAFEKTSSIKKIFENEPNYIVDEDELYKDDCLIGTFYNQGDIVLLIDKLKLDRSVWSCDIHPDGALYVPKKKTLYISEAKEQCGKGSVDFKPWGFPGLKWKYKKMFGQKNIDIKFCGVFSEYFNKDKFRDMFEYLDEKNIKQFFNKIDLSWFDFSGIVEEGKSDVIHLF